MEVEEWGQGHRVDFGGSTEYLVVQAVDIASLIVFGDLLVDGGVKETMEVFGLGIG